MNRDEIVKEACYQFVQTMTDMPLYMAMSMLATCITIYAYKKITEGGGTNGQNDSSNSV